MESREEIKQYSLEWYKEMRKLNKDTIISLVESNGKQRDTLKEQNKAQLEEIERLKSELKDCTENYNHYVDKCFKLESELKAEEWISVEDVDNIQELKSQIALLKIQLKDSKQDVEILKFELKAADSVNEKLQRELEIFKN